MDEDKCAQCGTPAAPGAKFCESCGAPLAAATQPVEVKHVDEDKCAQCGTPAAPGAKFCESCGAPLAAATQPVEVKHVDEDKCAQCGTPASTRREVLRKLWRTTSCSYTTSSRPSCRGTRFCVRSTTGASGLLRTWRPSAVSGRRYSLCRDTHRCNNRRDHIYNTGLAFDAICFEFYNWDLCDSSDRSHHLSSVLHTASRALWADCGYDASPDKSSQRGGLLSDQLWRSGNTNHFVGHRRDSIRHPLPARRNPYLDFR